MALSPHVQNRFVILPWAQSSHHDTMEHVFHSISRNQIQADALAAKVGSTQLPLGSEQAKAQQKPNSSSETTEFDAPPLGSLPYSPIPQIPENDRPLYVQEELISAAVALDVLSTTTRTLKRDETILSKLTETLLMLGELSGATIQDQTQLIEFAKNQAGMERESLALQLSDALENTKAPTEASPQQPPPTAITPLHVQRSLHAIEAMADQAVLEAYLLIESQQLIEYKQA